MKHFLMISLSLFSISAFAGLDVQTYVPDENHLPGYRSPALQKQAQEERPTEVKSSKKIDTRFHEKKCIEKCTEAEAIDKPILPAE